MRPSRAKHQQKPERDGCLPRMASRQQSRSRERADDDACQHGPKPSRQSPETRACRQLPDIGDERRHDQKRGGLGGRHHKTEQAHRDGRQSEPDHALDETGEQEGEGCDDEGKVFDGHARQTETKSTGLGSLSNSFHRRLRKNTIELATRKRISSTAALEPNTLAVA